MKKGIDFLESKLYLNKNKSNLSNKLVDLPPIFKVFIENFKWNQKLIEVDNNIYFLPYLKGGEVDLNKWNYEEIFSKPIVFRSDNLEKLGFITIATTREGIHIGTKGEYIDKVFTFENSLENSHVQIADNIFQFVNGLTNNISMCAETESEYRSYMIQLGYFGNDLEQEVNDWNKWKQKSNEKYDTQQGI